MAVAGAAHSQFYVTLPSNSSMQYYPNNTTSNFITHLSSAINVSDGAQWEVALVEAHYPNSFLTVGNDAMIYIYLENNEQVDAAAAVAASDSMLSDSPTAAVDEITGETKTKPSLPPPPPPPPPPSPKTTGEQISSQIKSIKVPAGDYKNIEDLLRTMNRDTELLKYVTFSYAKATQMVEIYPSLDVSQVELCTSLALVLGFDPNETDLLTNRKSIRPADIYAALPSHMYVYCDLAEPQFVGDTVAPLLKIVNIDTTTSRYKYGANKMVHFIDPHYVPLMRTKFESVEIDLRDDTGQRMPFYFGTTCMKLHFRRVSAQQKQ